jgi:hypothetical protein
VVPYAGWSRAYAPRKGSLGNRRIITDILPRTIEQGLGAFAANLEVAAEAKRQNRLESEDREGNTRTFFLDALPGEAEHTG